MIFLISQASWWIQPHLKDIRQNGWKSSLLFGVKIPKMSFELPPPTAGIWVIPKRFRQLCRLAGFVKMTEVPIFPNKIQGLPFHHQKRTRKKWGETRKSTKGLATCQSLGLRFSHVTVGSYGGPRDRMSSLQFSASCKSIHPSCRQPNHPSTSSTLFCCWCVGVQRKTEKPYVILTVWE